MWIKYRPCLAMLMLDCSNELYHLFLQEEHNFDYHLRMLQDKLRVKQIMSDELVCLPPAVKLSELAHILRSTTHGSFPVATDAIGMGTNRDGIDLEGVVTRIQLLRMMQNRVGFVKVVSSMALAEALCRQQLVWCLIAVLASFCSGQENNTIQWPTVLLTSTKITSYSFICQAICALISEGFWFSFHRKISIHSTHHQILFPEHNLSA